MICLLAHRWSFPQAQGRRDRSGRFIRTGPDVQRCHDCTKERVSPIQFGPEKAAEDVGEGARPVRARTV